MGIRPTVSVEPSRVMLDEALITVPRLLSLVNQNEASSLFGCFDRSYWNYKLIDFPCGRKQESCLSFSLLYSCDFQGLNPFYKNRKIARLAKGATLFLARMQHKDGTFDQFWPNEVSSAASMFPAYCLAASYAEIKHLFASREREEIEESLTRSLKLGLRLEETDFGSEGALNQEMGAICAMYAACNVLDASNNIPRLRTRLDALLQFQNPEGWIPEFFGADVGYSFVTLDYMMKIHEMDSYEPIMESAKKLVGFLKYLVHPNGSVGGEYASRNTEWVAPHGLALLSLHSADANAVFRRFAQGVRTCQNVGLKYMDDRYLSYEHYTFVQAALVQAEPLYPPSTLPFEVDSQQTVFVESGLTTITAFDYYIIYSQGKGGVFRVYNRRSGEILLNDTGVVIIDEKNSALVSGWLQLHLKPKFEIEQKNDEIILRSGGVLVRYRDTVPNSIYMVLSRVGLTVISSSFWLRRKLLDILRSKLITKRPKPRGRFQRELKLDSMKLRVTDTIDPFDKKKNRVLVTNRTTDRYITSKQFGQFQDILSIKPLKTEIAYSDSSVTVIREYDLSAPMVPAQSYIFTQERSLKG